MAKFGKFKYSDLKKLEKEINRANKEVDDFIQSCSKELAARLLAKVIKRTPVGEYSNSSGKKGGTLRRGWTAGKNIEASKYINELKVNTFGDTYVIEIVNPVKYASYVEFGHRTPNHKGWVNGRFMLTISAQEIEVSAPGILERKLRKRFGELFK